MDIKWLDGKNADGMFILEMQFSNGTKAYMKNESHDQIAHYMELAKEMPDCTATLIHRAA